MHTLQFVFFLEQTVPNVNKLEEEITEETVV